MAAVTVSPKYQVVIPSALRRKLGIQAGQKVEVLVYEGRLEMIPVSDVREARGLARGIDTHIQRDGDRV